MNFSTKIGIGSIAIVALIGIAHAQINTVVGTSVTLPAPTPATTSANAAASTTGVASTTMAASTTAPVVIVLTPVATPVSSCPVVSTFMKRGASTNESSEVSKLQAFLATQGTDVSVTGTFDEKTEDAVKAFQKKYEADILAPWGATRASGIVHVTTAKKINQIACNVPLALNGEEMSIIRDYVASASTTTGTQTADNTVMGAPMPAGDQLVAGAANVDGDDVATDTESTDNNGSVFSRFWAFVKSLF